MKVRHILPLALLGCSMVAAASGSTSDRQIASLQTQINRLQNRIDNIGTKSFAKIESGNFIKINSKASAGVLAMVNNPEQVLLKDRENGLIPNKSVIVGGMLQFDAGYQYSSDPVSVLNPSYAQQNNASSVLWLGQMRLGAIVAMSKNLTGYLQLGNVNYNDVNGNSSSSMGMGVTRAFVVMKNPLGQKDFHAFFGLKPVNFGAMEQVNPYTVPLTKMFYYQVADSLGAGYTHQNVSLSATVFNGGSDQEQTPYINGNIFSQSPGFYTDNPHINNLALNASLKGVHQGVDWRVGAGYLSGGPDFVHLGDQDGTPNSVWDLNGDFKYKNFGGVAELTSTGSDVWFSENKFVAYNLGAYMDQPFMGATTRFSASWSAMSWGSESSGIGTGRSGGTEIVLGASRVIYTNTRLGLEFAQANGVYDHLNKTWKGDARNSRVILALTAGF